MSGWRAIHSMGQNPTAARQLEHIFRLKFVDWGEEILEEINTPEDYVGLWEASAGD